MIFREDSGAKAFFLGILLWGIGVGAFAAGLNNYLSDICKMNSVDRGVLEFFRELPGLVLVFILALLHKWSNWKVMRLGIWISMAGAAFLLIPGNKLFIVSAIMVWSMGEHLVMPVRNAIAIEVARKGHEGESLGYLAGIMNFGSVAGSLLVALLFFLGTRVFSAENTRLFQILFVVIFLLLTVSLISSRTPRGCSDAAKRPRLLFRKKFTLYYLLELFYGARKQIFLTFAPYVLIREYDFPTASMALLFGIAAFVNIFASPAVGKLSDRWGYRNVMIWDTVILFFVCLLYGYAGNLFPVKIAFWVVTINFLLDAVISTTALATNLYVKTLSRDREELTSTFSTGISINHLIAILFAPFGGWIWQKYGIGVLFSLAAVMAIGNTLLALCVPKEKKV